MQIAIKFNGDVNPEVAHDLDELFESLADSELSVKAIKGAKLPGSKDAGLTLALSIAGLAFSAIGTLISVLSAWKARHNYSVSFRIGETTISAGNLSPQKAQEIAGALQGAQPSTEVQVAISPK